MAIRVGTTEKQPTHHVKLTDRDGNSVGLILCNDKGEPAPMYNKTPIDRSALKTQSGGSTYADYNYPYAPIAQDDWSGGRGNLDFERDSTRYLDSYNVNTRNPNKAYLNGMMHPSTGYKTVEWNQTYSEPARLWTSGVGNVVISPVASFTLGRIWIYVREHPSATAANLTVQVKLALSPYTVMGTGTLIASLLDKIGGWVCIDVSASLTAGTLYKLEATTSAAAVQTIAQNITPTTNLSWGPIYVIESTVASKTCIYYEYKGAQYKVLSAATGAPTVWLNGDRGAADSNAGQLTKLIDATKAWTIDQWKGCVVKIVQGTGSTETQQWRMITSNTATELVSSTWIIQHDTTTEYVIYGADTWRELTGHGLTAPVTAVLPVGNVIYFAQGDDVLMRSHQEYNNAGVWTESDWNEEANIRGTYLAYQPLSAKLWIAQKTGLWSTSVQTYGTDLNTFTAVTVGYTYEFINGLEVYPNDSGTEALWVYKEELAYSVTTTATGIKLDEMRYLRSRDNGKANLVHNVYSYFTLGQGLQRYYGGSIDSVGPNLDEGLPTNRQGNIVKMIGFPGRVIVAIDATAAGYSSVLERDGSGWHEVYRAPYGQRIRDIAYQVIPGKVIDKLWIFHGDVSVYVPMATQGRSELDIEDGAIGTSDSGSYENYYTYATEGALVLSRMHAGMFDTQKIIQSIQIWADNLVFYTDRDGIELGVDYRLGEDDAWTTLEITKANPISSPPVTRSGGVWSDANITNTTISSIDLTQSFGLAGKMIQMRLRFFSNMITKTPLLRAAVVQAVMRSQIKYMYNLTFRVVDDEPSLTPREMDEDSITAASMSAITKLAQLESWADADTEGLLYMTSNSPLYDGKYVFINPPVTRQIATDPDSTRQWTGFGFVCSTTAQEA